MCGSGGLSVEIERTDLVLQWELKRKSGFSVQQVLATVPGEWRTPQSGASQIGLSWKRLVCWQPWFLKAECVRGELHSGLFKPANAYPEPLS
jgi:hypothetical protein